MQQHQEAEHYVYNGCISHLNMFVPRPASAFSLRLFTCWFFCVQSWIVLQSFCTVCFQFCLGFLVFYLQSFWTDFEKLFFLQPSFFQEMGTFTFFVSLNSPSPNPCPPESPALPPIFSSTETPSDAQSSHAPAYGPASIQLRQNSLEDCRGWRCSSQKSS